jgi:hypothetical protein
MLQGNSKKTTMISKYNLKGIKCYSLWKNKWGKIIKNFLMDKL